MSGRIIQLFGTNKPGGAKMSTVASITDFKKLAEASEKREQLRHGGTREHARERIARRLGINPGTLYNLARDRLKRIDASFRDALTAYAVKDLQADIERLTHELELARQMGAHQDSPHISEIERHLKAARDLIAETAR